VLVLETGVVRLAEVEEVVRELLGLDWAEFCRDVLARGVEDPLDDLPVDIRVDRSAIALGLRASSS
jgi:hypothetical protein